MLRYSLAKQGRRAGRKSGTVAYLPEIPVRLSAERDYEKALRSMLRQMAAEVRESIIPAYEADLAQRKAQEAITVDAADRSWFVRLDALKASLVRVAQSTVDRILNLEAERHTENFAAAVKRAIGIDIRAVIAQEDLGDYLTTASARNASLIQSLADDTVKKVEQAVYQNSVAGNSVTTLRKQLVQEFGVSESRAKLIASDQMGKANADLTEIRQRQAGVTEYVWSTSHDERVRSRHRALDGKRYKWGEATGAEQGLPPGKPIRCRCWARGVIEF
ncbi:minor capsid protein [Martelella lutilitoris]|uniref:Minor capsid protein n=1 Tax=Martelella lutilitoris TaxID=2583532 RepID=A0A7T7HHJ4_9HYPH|nr:minor capsid protein [Martelella lutilitoris]QQM29304.1 minor capsid protein [Martelella lutilitoris]